MFRFFKLLLGFQQVSQVIQCMFILGFYSDGFFVENHSVINLPLIDKFFGNIVVNFGIFVTNIETRGKKIDFVFPLITSNMRSQNKGQKHNDNKRIQTFFVDTF
eukprot:TRINITY_DN8691_c0_g1_i4.p2 TRINITY_DN8691_c0_g1~~TRINITY_DN8691_c0_g1_i4.p2  ORF type:complete len:104 (+),score=0.08 TRINITY_DN8691_c0_g1_i4:376-687(+)